MASNDKKHTIPAKESNARRTSKFREIYEEYFDRLCSYAFVITNSYETSKDVVSEVFYNLWKSDSNLSEIKEMKSYLFASVKNQAIRTISKNPMSFEHFHSQIELKAIEYLSPEDLMIGNELASKINEVIESLPPQCQLVFKMVKEENLRYNEVADKLGISSSMVKQHMIAALKTMRLSLDKHFNDTRIISLASSLVCLLSILGLGYYIINNIAHLLDVFI